MKLNDTHSARLLGTTIAPATQWPIEVYAIHPTTDPGASVAQVQIFRDRGTWYLWTGNLVRERDRALGRMLATVRNLLEGP